MREREKKRYVEWDVVQNKNGILAFVSFFNSLIKCIEVQYTIQYTSCIEVYEPFFFHLST